MPFPDPQDFIVSREAGGHVLSNVRGERILTVPDDLASLVGGIEMATATFDRIQSRRFNSRKFGYRKEHLGIRMGRTEKGGLSWDIADLNMDVAPHFQVPRSVLEVGPSSPATALLGMANKAQVEGANSFRQAAEEPKDTAPGP